MTNEEQKLLEQKVERFRAILSQQLEDDLAKEDDDLAEHLAEIAQECLNDLDLVTNLAELSALATRYEEEVSTFVAAGKEHFEELRVQ
jgi:hypothetical protein